MELGIAHRQLIVWVLDDTFGQDIKDFSLLALVVLEVAPWKLEMALVFLDLIIKLLYKLICLVSKLLFQLLQLGQLRFEQKVKAPV